MEQITIPNNDDAKMSQQAAPEANKNLVSEADALSAASNADMPIISQDSSQKIITDNTTATNPTNSQIQSSSSVSAGSLIDGKLGIDLIDAVLPSVLVLLFHYVGMKLKKSDLQLTEREKQTLAPLLQRCLDTLMLNFNNPWAALGISATIIYGSKIMEKGGVTMIDARLKAKDEIKAQSKKAEAEIKSKPAAEKEPANKSNVEIIKDLQGQYDFSEDKIERFMKDRKMGRDRALKNMNNLHKRRRLPQQYY